MESQQPVQKDYQQVNQSTGDPRLQSPLIKNLEKAVIILSIPTFMVALIVSIGGMALYPMFMALGGAEGGELVWSTIFFVLMVVLSAAGLRFAFIARRSQSYQRKLIILIISLLFVVPLLFYLSSWIIPILFIILK